MNAITQTNPNDDEPAGATSAGIDADTWVEPTEDYVASAFCSKYAGEFVFDHTSKVWHIWRGGRWQRDLRSGVLNAARDFSRLVRAGLVKDAKSLAKINFSAAVEKASRADPRMAVSHEVWDNDPWLLGVAGGVVNLKTGQPDFARPDFYISRQCCCTPAKPGTPAPLWEDFLNAATNDDEEMIEFLQRLCGYLLTGTVTEEILTFLYGPGGNGKGVFLGAITAIMAEYAVAVPIEVFTAGSRLNLEYYRAQMAGARLVTASETEAQATWAEAQIKEMTGNEAPLSGRHPYGQPFTFSPQFKIMLVGNHAPKLKGRSAAMERRLRVIPFDHQPDPPDRDLKDKLKAEYPAILRWMIDGCLKWQGKSDGSDGLSLPSKIKAATGAYFEQQDAFRRWMDENCDLDAAFATKPGILLADYNGWAKANGEEPIGNNAFSENIDRCHQLKRVRTNVARLVKGIAIKPKHEAWHE